MSKRMKEELDSPDIRIDRDGIWYYQGVEMHRKDIVHTLYRHLKQDERGKYLIELAGEKAYVDVEDTPFVVQSLSYGTGDGDRETVFLRMPDESEEELNPSTLYIGADDVLYCTTDRGYRARFSRAAYYQLTTRVEYEEGRGLYFLPLNGRRFYLLKNYGACS